MKRTIVTFVLGILLHSVAFGQNTFAPEGSYWNYHWSSHTGDQKANWTIRVAKDTVIDGFNTKFLEKAYDIYYALPPNIPSKRKGVDAYGFLQVRSDSIFFTSSLSQKYKFLFNFNLKQGDTIPIFNNLFNIHAIVDTGYSINVNGHTLNKWELTKFCEGDTFENATIIENIGLISDYLLWNLEGCIIGGRRGDFMCFHSPEFEYNGPCDAVFVGKEKVNIEGNPILVFPNPTGNTLYIQVNTSRDNFEVSLLNSNLQRMKSQHQVDDDFLKMDLANLSSGIYFIRLKNDETIITRKVIKR